MTEEIKSEYTIGSSSEAVTAGKQLAPEILIARMIASMPDGADIIARSLSIGDGIEKGPHADIELIRMVGAEARQAVERISGMVTLIRSHPTP